MSFNRIAVTPQPPYYAAITTAQLASAFEPQAYRELGLKLVDSVQSIDGFLGLEVFFDGRASVALSYWRSLEAIDAWRRHPLHTIAKGRARSSWFGPCITRIARIEHDYGFNLPVNEARSER
jgi:heme-degrading monooxygenase HmoA